MKSRTVNIIFLLLFLTLMAMDVFGQIGLWPYFILLIAFSLVHAYGSVVLSAGFFTEVRFRGTPSESSIAISFDDGPIEGKTEKILEILRTKNTPAAFFCIGNRVRQNRSLAQRLDKEGHLLGNHSYWHGRLFDLQTPNGILNELNDTDDAIREAIGKKPLFFRPPYGVTNPMVAEALRQSQHKVIGWTVRSLDTVINDRDKLFRRVTRNLRSGDVVLFHDHCDSTVQILADFIDHANRVGLKIVRLDTLLNEKAYANA